MKLTTAGEEGEMFVRSKQRKTVHNGVSDPGGKPPDP